MAQSDLGKGIEDGTTVGISAMTTAGHDKQDKTAQRVVIGQLRFRSRKRSVRVQDQSEGAEFSGRRGCGTGDPKSYAGTRATRFASELITKRRRF